MNIKITRSLLIASLLSVSLQLAADPYCLPYPHCLHVQMEMTTIEQKEDSSWQSLWSKYINKLSTQPQKSKTKKQKKENK